MAVTPPYFDPELAAVLAVVVKKPATSSSNWSELLFTQFISGGCLQPPHNEVRRTEALRETASMTTTTTITGTAVPPHTCPEMVDLFAAYTASPQSIGSTLSRVKYRSLIGDPLIVATSFDIALYPGDGRPPEVEGLRVSVRGFKELAAASHVGPAVASLVSIRDRAGDEAWRTGAEHFIATARRARAANSAELWRDVIAVELSTTTSPPP
jgi:hypothetical protein